MLENQLIAGESALEKKHMGKNKKNNFVGWSQQLNMWGALWNYLEGWLWQLN